MLKMRHDYLFRLYSVQRLNSVYNDHANYEVYFLLKHNKMLAVSFKFFRFIIFFNLFVTVCILLQSPRFMLNPTGIVSFYMFIFWLKVFGSIISVAAEYIFHLPKKEIFLKNLHISPIRILAWLTTIDFLLFILLCIMLKFYLTTICI